MSTLPRILSGKRWLQLHESHILEMQFADLRFGFQFTSFPLSYHKETFLKSTIHRIQTSNRGKLLEELDLHQALAVKVVN